MPAAKKHVAQRLGQVFTPRPVADWMVRWACANRPRRILDPAVGRGVFVEAADDLLNKNNGHLRPCIDVYEIDAKLLNVFRNEPRITETRYRHDDFITAPVSDRYDAIVANPPYIRHHEMNYGEEILRDYDHLCGRRLSRMTNLYGLFLLRIWDRLAAGGRAAVITPAEWLNADFGRPIKAHFMEQNAIDGILHFDHAAAVFDGALTTAAITLLRRGRSINDPITMAAVQDVQTLRTLDLQKCRRVARSDLDPTRKWSPLFAPSGSAAPADGPTLGDIARCSRGIATGANGFFTLRESERKHHGIDRRDLALCITKAQQVAAGVLNKAHLEQLIEADQRVYLLRPRRRLTPEIKCYLAEGQRRGIHQRYLPSHRPVWYRPEERIPAPIWVSVFSRCGFRFVLNHADAMNLTAFHGIYLHSGNPDAIASLFAYLSSAQARSALENHRRIYADGLSKLEPRDVMALPIPSEVHELCHRRSSSLF